MIKEIMEQPEALRKTISPRLKDGRVVLDDIVLDPGYIKSLKKSLLSAAARLIMSAWSPNTILKRWHASRLKLY